MSDEHLPFSAPNRKITLEEGPPRKGLGTLWTARKDQHVMTCEIVEAPIGEELRVLVDGELYLTELYRGHEGLIARAHLLHEGLLARGWTAES